jgi:hypothetical protein
MLLPGETGSPWLGLARAAVLIVRDVGFPVLVSAFLLWELGPKIDRMLAYQAELSSQVRQLVEAQRYKPMESGPRGAGAIVAPVGSVVNSPAPPPVERVGRETCATGTQGAFRSFGIRCAE